MINKITSIGTLLCMLTVLLIGRIDPADPLFSFISLDPAASLLRLVLVLAMVGSTFMVLNSPSLRRALGAAGISLVGLVVASFVFAPVYSLLYGFLMPLDVLLIMETGIVFSAVAFDKQIEPEHRETEGVRIPVRVTA